MGKSRSMGEGERCFSGTAPAGHRIIQSMSFDIRSAGGGLSNPNPNPYSKPTPCFERRKPARRRQGGGALEECKRVRERKARELPQLPQTHRPPPEF